jgi:hypothetical protein
LDGYVIDIIEQYRAADLKDDGIAKVLIWLAFQKRGLAANNAAIAAEVMSAQFLDIAQVYQRYGAWPALPTHNSTHILSASVRSCVDPSL